MTLRVEELFTHNEIAWVIQTKALSIDIVFGGDEGEWRTVNLIPMYLNRNQEIVVEYFDDWIKPWLEKFPEREFRLHKTTNITRFEAIYLETSDD